MEMHEERKEDRTWAIVGTVAAILLCGLPGLCLFIPFSIVIYAHVFNYSTVGFDIAPGIGTFFLFLGAIFIAIAILVPLLTLRRKMPEHHPMDVPPSQERPPSPPPPMPPESHIPPQPPLPPDEPLPPTS
jgi:predicted transporter